MQETFGIGRAVEILLAGGQVARQGWHGKNMFLSMQRTKIGSEMTQPYIYICTPTADRVPWNASQMDIFAKDWVEV